MLRESRNKCSANAVGVGIGGVWAAYAFFMGNAAMFDWGVTLVDEISSLYIGYGPSIFGAVIGAVWGFVDGYIAGVVIAWVYNRLAKQAAEREIRSFSRLTEVPGTATVR